MRMHSTTLSPTAGYIPDFQEKNMPGILDSKERQYLRELARRVLEISARPEQEDKRALWYSHNKLEKVRPLLLVFPEDSWIDIIGEEALKLTDPFWRQWEWYLRHLLY